ncbi:MAG: septal ring lytic transglycosylase RlpA family protein [Rhizonema sp. PD37]|nr:septal ring lytic transglycosylase RlpA family protein [Rhizonema sp. PD37]
MNQRHFWTVVVFATILGIPSIGRAQTTKKSDPSSPSLPANDVVKVGEYQSPVENQAEKRASDAAVITKVITHDQAGHQAATLYVHNTPVLTFLGKQPVATTVTKVGVVGNIENPNKEAASEKIADSSTQTSASIDDPVQRATVVAVRINQLKRDNVDASKITVSWTADQQKSQSNKGRYVIKVNGEDLVEINHQTQLSETTNDPAEDALKATNRLRKLIGNVSPLSKITDSPLRFPKLPQEFSIGPVRISLKGMASWYGYDGSGNRTAGGERYNPEGMTAAHRSLPLGTRVRVTNTHNGRSVVVRINDRGPYARGRVIDLSAAAARILGMMGSGVAQVRIDVLGR